MTVDKGNFGLVYTLKNLSSITPLTFWNFFLLHNLYILHPDIIIIILRNDISLSRKYILN